MTGTNRDMFTHKLSRSYLNHLVVAAVSRKRNFAEGKPRSLQECTASGDEIALPPFGQLGNTSERKYMFISAKNYLSAHETTHLNVWKQISKSKP
jgi:hypothetical protein